MVDFQHEYVTCWELVFATGLAIMIRLAMTQPQSRSESIHLEPHLRAALPTPPSMQPTIAVPAVAALVYRAYSRKSLTPVGILVAFATAVVHALHPWSVFFVLLAVFFLAGSTVTKVCLMKNAIDEY